MCMEYVCEGSQVLCEGSHYEIIEIWNKKIIVEAQPLNDSEIFYPSQL